LLHQLEDSLLALKPANSGGQWRAGASHDACREDWRYPLAAGPAERRKNPKGGRRASDLLADLTVHPFGPVRTAQPCIGAGLDAMRTRCIRRHWNDPRIGAGVRWAAPCLATADAFRPLDS